MFTRKVYDRTKSVYYGKNQEKYYINVFSTRQLIYIFSSFRTTLFGFCDTYVRVMCISIYFFYIYKLFVFKDVKKKNVFYTLIFVQNYVILKKKIYIARLDYETFISKQK